MSGASGGAKAAAPKSHDVCHGWADHHPLGRMIVGFFLLGFALLLFVALMRGCSGSSSEDKPGAATPHRGSASPTVGRGGEEGGDLLSKILAPRSLLRWVSASEPFGTEHYLFLATKRPRGVAMAGAIALEENGVASTSVEGVMLSRRRLWVRAVRPTAGSTLSIEPNVWMYQATSGGPVRDSRKDSDWVNKGIEEEFELWLCPDIPFDPQHPTTITIAWEGGRR